MLKPKKSGKKKRELDKYPALNPRLNAKTRFEVLDMDYLKDLDDASLKYMNQFMSEYVSGGFKKDEDGGYSDENLNKTPEERRECYGRNNARTRCGLTVSNATGQTYRCDDISAFMDSLTDITLMVDSVNDISNLVHDNYQGDYDGLEEELVLEMMADYKICMNPVTAADRKMAESNYGKRLMLIFQDSDLIKKD